MGHIQRSDHGGKSRAGPLKTSGDSTNLNVSGAFWKISVYAFCMPFGVNQNTYRDATNWQVLL